MRAALTDCHTNRGALPSGCHPHEKQSTTESGEGRGLQITHLLFSLLQQQPVSSSPSTAEKSSFGLIRVSASSLYTITGYNVAAIKVPFQHSTHPDLSLCKHSLSQLKPRTLHWDLNGDFYACEKGKWMQVCTGKKCVFASSGKQSSMGCNHHFENVSLQLWQ